MSQKSNILTIRSPEISLNFNITNTQKFLEAYQVSKLLKKSLDKKGIILTDIAIKATNSNVFIKLKVFFGTQKLIKYKNSISTRKHQNIKTKFLGGLIQKVLNCKSLLIKTSILNRSLNIKNLQNYFNFFKKFKGTLFSRQFSLFIDFIKLTDLFVNKQVSNTTYLVILGKVFKILPKNKHSRYLFLINQLFDLIVKDPKNNISGLKLEIGGKLKGKLRSSSEKIIKGSISNPSIGKDIDYASLHVYTIYGTFGIKL